MSFDFIAAHSHTRKRISLEAFSNGRTSRNFEGQTSWSWKRQKISWKTDLYQRYVTLVPILPILRTFDTDFTNMYSYPFLLNILDCVQVIAKEGTYFVRQKFGSTKACGIYIAGYHNETVRVDFIKVDVTYNDGGVVAVSKPPFYGNRC